MAVPRRCCCEPAAMRAVPLEIKRESALLLLPAAAAVRASRSIKKKDGDGAEEWEDGGGQSSLSLSLALALSLASLARSLLRHNKKKRRSTLSSPHRCTLDRHALVVVTFYSFQSLALDMHSSALARRGGSRMASRPSTSPSLSSSMSSVARRQTSSSSPLLLANR